MHHAFLEDLIKDLKTHYHVHEDESEAFKKGYRQAVRHLERVYSYNPDDKL